MKSYAELARKVSEYQSSACALVAANLVPLFGVLFLSWDAFQTVALYWVEIVIIGLITLLKIATCDPDPAAVERGQMNQVEREAWSVVVREKRHGPRSECRRGASKMYEILAFAVPYAFCCFILGIATAYAFGAGEDIGEGDIKITLRDLHELHLSQLVWGAAALGASHLYSYVHNYLGRREYRRTVVTLLMLQPYGRALVLYTAVLVGMWFATVLGENIGVLSVLIAGKTLMDLRLHLRERENNAAAVSPIVAEEPLSEPQEP